VIRQDAVSFFFFALSTTMLAFIFVSGQSLLTTISFATVTMLFLSVIGLIGEPLANKLRRHPEADVDVSLDKDDQMNIVFGFLVATIGLILSSLFVKVFVNSAGSLSIVTFISVVPLDVSNFNNFFGSLMFSAVLVPTSEENFFRGFWANLAIAKLGRFGGQLSQASIFAGFHFPAYSALIASGLLTPTSFGVPGISPTELLFVVLSIIFVDGLVLGVVDEQAQSLSPSILAHGANNLLFFAVAAGVVALPFGHPLMILLAARVPLTLAIGAVWRLNR
jgi:membrane protease YdiL (CAAX protease family)